MNFKLILKFVAILIKFIIIIIIIIISQAPLKRRKQITSIRDDLKQFTAAGDSSGSPSSPSTHPRYISSQYLSDSSLSTDVSQYDFTLPHYHQYGSAGGASTESSSIDEDSGNVSFYCSRKPHVRMVGTW